MAQGAIRAAHSILLSCLVAFELSTLARPVRAAEPSIWYRAGDGCPDGASFLERLARRGIRARLAGVGDPVDFVVTLGATGEGSSGRLERQSSRGTIAIRQVEDARCEAVADVLALSLALADDPGAASVSTPGAAPKSSDPAPNAARPVSSDAARVSPAGPEPRGSAAPAAATPPPRSLVGAPPREPSATLALGAEVSAWDALDGPWLFGAGPYVELGAPASFALPNATARAVLRGALRFDDGESDVDVWLASARLDVCPVGLTAGYLALRPCAALDLGVIRASAAGEADAAFWSAGAVHARGALGFGKVTVEAQGGLVFPFTRYEVADAEGLLLEKTRATGFAGGLGANVRFE